ncbi:MAG TPA: citrate synthase [Candidatus Xenobia bacterium]|jgi:citrate synthase
MSQTSAPDGFKEGLEDVVAASSSICFIDGVKGILAYRGYNIHDLATHSTFEETCHLLWYGALPTKAELKSTRDALAASRGLPAEVLKFMGTLPKDAVTMDVLRTVPSLLGIYDADSKDNSLAANMRKAIRLTAQMPTVVAAWQRMRLGQPLVAPDASLDHAANFLYMLRGEKPEARATKALDVALILHADHEFNASTFTARVTASTLTDMHSSVTAAIGALKGPLHGGANMEVMAMLRAIGTVDKVDEYIKNMLNAKKKVSGFGHRVYRTEDPRATHLRKMSKELSEAIQEPVWYQMSRAVEEVVNREKKLAANVDFYSASVYHDLGIVDDLFTPIFAMSRVSGWTAHVLEQLTHNRILRPRADYTGAEHADYVPIEQRKESPAVAKV